MDAEKQKWLDEVGIEKLDKPVVDDENPLKIFTHRCRFPEGCCPPKMLYSTEYLEETPLDELQRKHARYSTPFRE